MMFATGRYADTGKLGLETAGVNVRPNGKLDAVDERTNVENIYAIGDVLEVFFFF